LRASENLVSVPGDRHPGLVIEGERVLVAMTAATSSTLAW
jgi:hypothetical protein